MLLLLNHSSSTCNHNHMSNTRNSSHSNGLSSHHRVASMGNRCSNRDSRSSITSETCEGLMRSIEAYVRIEMIDLARLGNFYEAGQAGQGGAGLGDDIEMRKTLKLLFARTHMCNECNADRQARLQKYCGTLLTDLNAGY